MKYKKNLAALSQWIRQEFAKAGLWARTTLASSVTWGAPCPRAWGTYLSTCVNVLWPYLGHSIWSVIYQITIKKQSPFKVCIIYFRKSDLLIKKFFSILFNFLSFWPCQETYVILLPIPGIDPSPSVLQVQSLNPWTTREVPRIF